MGRIDHSQPTIILVVGMHRSGTSLVARGLHAMGLNLGDRVDTEPHPTNPHGHWEHADVWRAQERLLASLGREWHTSPGPLPSRWLEWPDTIAIIGQFTALATAELSRRGHWVVKDPRTSLLIPLWRDVAQGLNARLTIVRLMRNADDVAASLAVRDGIPHDRAVQMWNDHQWSIDRDSTGLETLTIGHAMLLREPRAVFGEIGAFCGLTDASNRAPMAAALVDEALWHHRRHADSDNVRVPSWVESRSDPGPPVDKGRVLIVMRTRWRPHVLPRGLRSVLCQTYRNWFLQIVNDGGPRGALPPHAFDEVIFTNSSVYGPAWPMERAFQSPASENGGLWGMSISRHHTPHLQSYFMAMSQSLLTSKLGQELWEDVMPFTDKGVVIEAYELSWMERCLAAGVPVDAIFDTRRIASIPLSEHVANLVRWPPRLALARRYRRAVRRRPSNPTHLHWKAMLESGVPFLKVDLFSRNPYGMRLSRVYDWLQRHTDYPVELIRRHQARLQRPSAAA